MERMMLAAEQRHSSHKIKRLRPGKTHVPAIRERKMCINEFFFFLSEVGVHGCTQLGPSCCS